MDNIGAMKFVEGFSVIAEDGSWTIIGKTKASRTYQGRKAIFEELVPMLAGFQAPPQVKFAAPIVEGDRAVMLGAGTGIGPTGTPYEQPFYAWVTRVRGDEIVEIIEFLDTAELDMVGFGRKLVDA
jgi:hypothetical protein